MSPAKLIVAAAYQTNLSNRIHYLQANSRNYFSQCLLLICPRGQDVAGVRGTSWTREVAMSILSEPDAAMAPLYSWLELQHAAFSPLRVAISSTQSFLDAPLNPIGQTLFGRSMSAACELFERATRHYKKPAWNLHAVSDEGEEIAVEPIVVWQKPFCKLLHFERPIAQLHPKLLIVAPMSGHHATLLRGTVERFLPNHDVYITDWVDARLVPLSAGLFDLDDYIDYVTAILRYLGADTHVLAVCQPAVPVLAAVSLMEEDNDPCAPLSMTLMGGPIDPSANPTAVNQLAHSKGIEWFARHAVHTVPASYPGARRRVYPGFAQLAGFVGLNFERHVDAHRAFFMHLLQGDGESAKRHREFYDEYLAVMDLTAEFYLQTVDSVFIKHTLAEGAMLHRGRPVRPSYIRRVALFTVEGEKDHITGVGQTEAAHRLCSALPRDRKAHYVQRGVGHYGLFNGARFREEIAPRIAEFLRSHAAPRSQQRWIGDLSTRLIAASTRATAARRPFPRHLPIAQRQTRDAIPAAGSKAAVDNQVNLFGRQTSAIRSPLTHSPSR
jgi:poly(3-hydroxybutyrate) depolymerase